MQIQKTKFQGLDAIEICTSKLRLAAVTEFGPRIACFGPGAGTNLLLWKPEQYTRGDWDLRGGHRVWVTRPGADECEDTYAVDNGVCDVEVFENGFCAVGAENPANRTRRGIRVEVVAEDKLRVDNFLINTGDMLYSGGIWALTCTVPTPGTRYAVPVGDRSSWDSFNMVFFREWAGHGKGGFNDPQIKILEDLVLITPAGVENKRALMSHSGIIGMSDPTCDITFAKQVNLVPAGHYPMGTNIAFYIGPDNFMVEMETMGYEQTLKPGASLHHVETWVLRNGAASFNNAEELLAMFS